MTFAVLTILGFIVRGVWMMRSSPRLQHPISRIAPHIIDTLFLVTGIAMIVQMQLAVMQNPWLLAKFAGLAFYIVLGAIALRRGRTMQIRMAAFFAALFSFAYVIGAAVNKSPLSWLA